MTITPEQLKALEALELAHDAVRGAWADYKPYRNIGVYLPSRNWAKRTDNEAYTMCDALDTLTAAI